MLNATSPAVLAFVAAYQENQTTAYRGRWTRKVIAEDRRKYIAIDEVDDDATPPYTYPHINSRSGRFLIDRADGVVYSIHGYGQRGDRLGTMERMTEKYRAATATFDPSRHMHSETRGSKVASTSPTPRPAFAVLQGGLPRKRRGTLFGRIGDRVARRRGRR